MVSWHNGNTLAWVRGARRPGLDPLTWISSLKLSGLQFPHLQNEAIRLKDVLSLQFNAITLEKETEEWGREKGEEGEEGVWGAQLRPTGKRKEEERGKEN